MPTPPRPSSRPRAKRSSAPSGIAAEATEARDLAGIALETTRERAGRTDRGARRRAIDRAGPRSPTSSPSSRPRPVPPRARPSVRRISRPRLDAAIAARDDAVAQADIARPSSWRRARSDTEQLRTQAASIGDELAATQAALDDARATSAQAARRDLQRARQDAQDARSGALAAARWPRPCPPPSSAPYPIRCPTSGGRPRVGRPRVSRPPGGGLASADSRWQTSAGAVAVRRRDRLGLPSGAGRVRRRCRARGAHEAGEASEAGEAGHEVPHGRDPDGRPPGTGRRARGRARGVARA